jgi:poly-gamma-glutamate synthesis protein (capsule biosynthesis protein)
VWFPEYLPEGLVDRITLPAGYHITTDREEAGITLTVGGENQVSRWVYALVAPYPTIADGVPAEAFHRSWRGESRGSFSGAPILLDESTLGVFSALWGEPADGSVKVLPPGDLIDYAWENQPAWALVPFEALEPRWKVLEIGGMSPLRTDFDPLTYPLTVPISIQGSSHEERLGIPATNRDPSLLTTVALTGVTALVRATAFTMHRNGITYPAGEIGAMLSRADITHISNEIPFTPDCPPPDPSQTGLRFCSDPAYIALLDEVGADVIELTGDHFGDWGPEAMRYTLDLYKERGWMYYGGGYDLHDARQPRLIEHNGNRLAFIGCNGKGGGYATASEVQPGAAACDFDYMERQIRDLREEGYQVIATFQHFEYYTYSPQPAQARDFRRLAKAGASVVSGSQAHQPQGMEFFSGAFIHYGLGNLFFDQYHFCTDNACDDAFIDVHVFYDGRYLGNELVTTVFIDYAKPRLMNPDERQVLLEVIFAASGW